MRLDIFCRIVDNFGDIGVCWRLSQQLTREHSFQIRLFIDELKIASNIIPNLNCLLETQIINNIEICTWESAKTTEPANIAIETFSCGLPAKYLSSLPADSVWVNLEYLSAESWVADFHARNSNNTRPPRQFFFPGFTEATGGLIRESDIFQKNQSIANNQQLQINFLKSLNLQLTDELKISLFCYPHAPILDLLNAMAESKQTINCYVPVSGILPSIIEFFNLDDIEAGIKVSKKNLNLYVVPFLSQSDYDKLLSLCDINFVRGEDSWIRAIWSAKPFIWQPYFQTENTHFTKLNAFLDLFYANCEPHAKQAIYEIHSSWLAGNVTTQIWQNYLDNFHSIKLFTQHQSSQLASQADLASKLVIFLQKVRVKV
jgi:uncharacterized repeat protein (TIGR03837 family)